MTKEEILNMPAGREMDALVAEKVMGWEEVECWDRSLKFNGSDLWWNGIPKDKEEIEVIPHYSTSISAAWLVVEQMRKSNWKWFEMDMRPSGWRVNFVGDPQYNIYAETAPLAICRASLLTVMDGK